MSLTNYKELIVWQKSMSLVTEIYQLVKFLPKEETYALSDQMRRAAVSIPSNIAEGQARNSTREFVNFLSIARGSKAELETQLMICVRLKYLSGLAVLGEISIAGTLIKVDELANCLQVCLDSGAKKVLLPITSAADLSTVPAELIGCFNLIFYSSA